jgi:signal transduction histidine kinase
LPQLFDEEKADHNQADLLNPIQKMLCNSKVYVDDGGFCQTVIDSWIQIAKDHDYISLRDTIVEIFLISDSEKIQIIVQDDGRGVKDKEEVFELYTQSSSGPSGIEKKGTGIGLHFVKLLCEGLKLEYKIEDSLTLGGAKFILTKRLKEQKNV